MNDRHYIGGGNVAGILGVSPYKTQLQEYLGIIGEREPETKDRESFFRRRKSFEPVAIEAFEEKTCVQIAHVNERYTDSVFPFIKAEIDAETIDGANVEIKTCHPLAARDWGEEGEDACPVYVTAQAMHGLAVTNRQLCYVLAMIGFDDIRVYKIHRDDETIGAMRAREVVFWTENVLKRIPPEPTSVDDMMRLFARDNGETVTATPEIEVLVDELRDAKAAAKRADDLADRLKLYIAGASNLVSADGRALASWKAQSAKRFDQALFSSAHPELFEQFKRTSESRVLRIR